MISLSSLKIKQICFWRCYLYPKHCFDLVVLLTNNSVNLQKDRICGKGLLVKFYLKDNVYLFTGLPWTVGQVVHCSRGPNWGPVWTEIQPSIQRTILMPWHWLHLPGEWGTCCHTDYWHPLYLGSIGYRIILERTVLILPLWLPTCWGVPGNTNSSLKIQCWLSVNWMCQRAQWKAWPPLNSIQWWRTSSLSTPLGDSFWLGNWFEKMLG